MSITSNVAQASLQTNLKNTYNNRTNYCKNLEFKPYGDSDVINKYFAYCEDSENGIKNRLYFIFKNVNCTSGTFNSSTGKCDA